MKEKTQEPDLIDRIADALPSDDVRTAYYREMRHLRSLPESDELLRILRAMMFLTVLTEQIPARVLTEREKLEHACTEIIGTAKRLEVIESNYYQKLDQRLIQLPRDIEKGISPKAIVELINENLKQQFTASTIPIVAQKLADNANTIKTATKEYTRASAELCNSWLTTANKAQTTIDKINGAITGAVNATQQAALDFSDDFRKAFNKACWMFFAMALATEILIVLLIFGYLQPRMKTIYEIPPEVLLMIEQQKEQEPILIPQRK